MNQPPSCDKVFAIQKLSDFFEEIFKNLCKKGKRGKRKEKREKGISLLYVNK